MSINTAIKNKFLLATTVALIGVSGFAAANDKDLIATTIPASSCTPVNSKQAEMVFLQNGSWVFRNGVTGGVGFYCPLPLNAYTVSNNTNDNDMTHFRIYYRDTDGKGTAATLTARLKRKLTNGAQLWGTQWNSNNVNVSGQTAQIHPYLHDLAFSAQYVMNVTMGRNNTTQRPIFTGIDFPAGSFIP